MDISLLNPLSVLILHQFLYVKPANSQIFTLFQKVFAYPIITALYYMSRGLSFKGQE